MAVLISRETSSPAVSVTLNSSDDSGVVSCVSSIVRGTLQTPGNSIKEPLVTVTSLPSVWKTYAPLLYNYILTIVKYVVN